MANQWVSGCALPLSHPQSFDSKSILSRYVLLYPADGQADGHEIFQNIIGAMRGEIQPNRLSDSQFALQKSSANEKGLAYCDKKHE
jgi:hypothetical protein